jgi:ABC-type multidrug transport system fused ATPase/permease subunit
VQTEALKVQLKDEQSRLSATDASLSAVSRQRESEVAELRSSLQSTVQRADSAAAVVAAKSAETAALTRRLDDARAELVSLNEQLAQLQGTHDSTVQQLQRSEERGALVQLVAVCVAVVVVAAAAVVVVVAAAAAAVVVVCCCLFVVCCCLLLCHGLLRCAVRRPRHC